MTAPDSRRRRLRGDDVVIDLRQAAAIRQPGPAAEPPAPADVDLLDGDLALVDAVRGLGAAALLPGLSGLGRHAGSLVQRRLVEDSEAAPPRLQTHDAAGARLDRVVVHPAWEQLVRAGTEAGLAGRPWASTEPHAHLARAAGLLLWAQTAGSSAVALSTSHAVAAAVAVTPAAAAWLPRLSSRRTVPGARRGGPPARPATSAAVALTERGSSAPGAVPTTTAVPEPGGPVEGGPTWRVGGRKTFVGNADADVLLVSAATADGAGLFLLPRPADGALAVERLRPGSAHRAWVVGDLVLRQAWAVRLDTPGPPAGLPAPRDGRRPAAALEAARVLDGAVLAAASLRAAVRLAGTHARHRHVPGGPLDTVPGVRTLLADLAVESEAATLLALRLAAATDGAVATAGSAATPGPGPGPGHGHGHGHGNSHGHGHGDGGDPAEQAALLRLAGPVAAAWLSRRAPQAALEARELLGSAGWDETSEVARVHAQSSAVLASATAHGLGAEVVRVVSEDPEAVEAFLLECGRAAGAARRLDASVAATAEVLRAAAAEARQDPGAVHAAARWLVERLAVTLQGALVLQGAPAPVAEAFLASRLDSFGARGVVPLPMGSRQAALVVDRALGDV